MRGLHTSDWHVGKTNYSVRRDGDHDLVFERIYEIAKSEQVDVIIHTGDLFEKADPGTDVLKRGIAYMERLAEVAPLIVLAGNHDSNGLFEVVDALISARAPRVHPIYFVHTSRVKSARYGMIELPANGGKERILFAGLPFIRPAAFSRQYQELGVVKSSGGFADRIDELIANVGKQFKAEYDASRDIRIFAAHLLLQGSVVGGIDRGERALDIDEDSFGARPASVPSADYAAFGHIHKAQTPPGCSWARYAGSPLAVDFGESGEAKGVQLIDITPGIPARVQFIEVDGGRKLVSATLPYADIPSNAENFKGKLLKLTVVLEGHERNVYDYVKESCPGTDIARVFESVVSQGTVILSDDPDVAPSSPPEMFASFIANKRGFDKERATRYFNDLYAGAVNGENVRLPDVDALEPA